MYLLFAGHKYYPVGGFDDLKTTGSIDKCKKFFQDYAVEIANMQYINNWGHIVDAKTFVVVSRGEIENKGSLMIPGIAKWIDS